MVRVSRTRDCQQSLRRVRKVNVGTTRKRANEEETGERREAGFIRDEHNTHCRAIPSAVIAHVAGRENHRFPSEHNVRKLCPRPDPRTLSLKINEQPRSSRYTPLRYPPHRPRTIHRLLPYQSPSRRLFRVNTQTTWCFTPQGAFTVRVLNEIICLQHFQIHSHHTEVVLAIKTFTKIPICSEQNPHPKMNSKKSSYSKKRKK